MAIATNSFQLLASFFIKLGFFICLPAGIACYWYANSRQFESDHTKTQFIYIGRLFLLLFAGAFLPTLLLKILHL